MADNGGLALLAEHLPLLYPEITQSNRAVQADQPVVSDLSDQDFEFVTQVKGITLGEMQVCTGQAWTDRHSVGISIYYPVLFSMKW